jgi:3-dehydroquinate synthase
MAAGLYFSLKRGCISEDELNAAETLMQYFDLPIRVEGLDAEEIFKQMFYDKKTKDGKLNIVVLNKIGNAYTEKNATDTEVHSAIDYIIK